MKYLISALMILVTAGCQTLGGAVVESIKLPNGADGWVVDCSMDGMSSCFKAAGNKCQNGYLIHERTSNENTESKLPLEEMKQDGLIVEGHMPLSQGKIEDKYMVISCKQ